MNSTAALTILFQKDTEVLNDSVNHLFDQQIVYLNEPYKLIY